MVYLLFICLKVVIEIVEIGDCIIFLLIIGVLYGCKYLEIFW